MKSAIKGALSQFGVEIRRIRRANDQHEVPALYDDYMEAIYAGRYGEYAAFRCPIKESVTKTGFSFTPSGWNPFEATMRQCLQGVQKYEDSVLSRYYASWQPTDALQALLFAEPGHKPFRDYPGWAFITPFSIHSIESKYKHRRRYYERELFEASGQELSIEDGFKYHGPVSDSVGRTEFHRCRTILSSMKEDGYDRRHGDVGAVVVERNGDIRFVVSPGMHRHAAMAALGHDFIPAYVKYNGVFRTADIAYWPQVRKGPWTENQARRFVDHLFDFDARGWARERGLL